MGGKGGRRGATKNSCARNSAGKVAAEDWSRRAMWRSRAQNIVSSPSLFTFISSSLHPIKDVRR